MSRSPMTDDMRNQILNLWSRGSTKDEIFNVVCYPDGRFLDDRAIDRVLKNARAVLDPRAIEHPVGRRKERRRA